MFARLAAKLQGPQHPMTTAHRAGQAAITQDGLLRRTNGNKAMLRPLAQHASETRNASDTHENENNYAFLTGRQTALSGDFSSIPVFSSDRAEWLKLPLRPSRCPPSPDRPKLQLGAIDFQLEHERDNVAEHLMRTSVPDGSAAQLQVARQYSACEKQDELQKVPGGNQAVTQVLGRAVYRAGTPLEPAVRQNFERRFGRDFGAVRIHCDRETTREASMMGARAYTLGRHIAIREGMYDPSTAEGDRLLTHELTHVVQQAAFGDHQLADAPVLKTDHPAERQATAGTGTMTPLSAPAIQCDREQPRPHSLLEEPLQPPRSLTESLNARELSTAELNNEIELIERWLQAKMFTKDDSRILTFPLAKYRAELVRRKAVENRAQEDVRKKWERYPVEKIDEKIDQLRGDWLQALMTSGKPVQKPKYLERLEKERARRRDIRRARPVTEPRTADEAVSQIQEAWRDAEVEDPPDWKRSEALVARVDDWLRRLDADWHEKFSSMSGMTKQVVAVTLGNAVGAVEHLRYMQSYGGTIGGQWEYTVNSVRAAREYLRILGNETSLESSPVSDLDRSAKRGAVYTVAALSALPVAAAVTAAVAAAAPALAAASAELAGESIWATISWATVHPVLALEILTAATSTSVELAEYGEVDPMGLLFNLLHIYGAHLESSPGRSGPGASRAKIESPIGGEPEPSHVPAPAPARSVGPAADVAESARDEKPQPSGTPPGTATPTAEPRTSTATAPPKKAQPPPVKTYYGGGAGIRKGMKTTPMAEVEAAPPPRAGQPARARPRITLTDAEQKMVDEAEQASSRLGKPLQVKTKAAAETGDVAWSGYGRRGGGAALTKQVLDIGHEIGHDFAENTSLDAGIPGQSAASHAEKLAAVSNPGKALAVDRAICPDCVAFFQRYAQVRKVTVVIHEPGQTWVFRPDGVQVGLSPSAQVVLHPGGASAEPLSSGRQ